MLKHIAMQLTLAILVSLPSASHAEVVGGPKSRSNYATVRIHNAVDEAVNITIANVIVLDTPLEPFETRLVTYNLNSQTQTTINFTASLVAFPSVTATATAKLQKDRTTVVTITAPTSTTLSIDVQAPTRGRN